jgi:hypothetical protein
MAGIAKHDYAALFAEYDQRRAGGESHQTIKAAFESRGINWGTFQNRRTQAKKAHQSTPDRTTPGLGDEYTRVHLSTPGEPEYTEVDHSTPVHQGTLEEYQEVMEEVHQSVPDAPHLITDEEHPSTPEVHPELSPDDSSMAHPGVPARQEHLISTPMGHPGTPTPEDWDLWTTIKARWPEIEKMLADRQALLSTPLGTPGQTQKKTYVFDVRHIGLIDAYAQANRIELKDVIYLMCEEFFQHR